MSKNIVVVGGGTAGWLASLYAKKRYPECEVTVIESSKIGILGAGEGVVPFVLNSFEYLDISLEDIINNSMATIKVATKFTNWSDKTPEYYLGLGTKRGQVIVDGVTKIPGSDSIPSAKVISYANNISDYDNDFAVNICVKNKVPIIYNSGKYDYYQGIAIHFDASLLAKFLKSKSVERGISHIDSLVVDAIVDGESIRSITLEDNSIINVDFLIDATGFERYFIGKKLNSEWISYSDSLPMNEAQAFFRPIDPDNIEPYTESIAMDYGWSWKIPLQHRYGCGYLYDNKYINNDQAREEINKKFGEVEFVKKFNFNTGHYKRVFIGNCLSVGLASGFVEPMEATSLWQTVFLLDDVFLNEDDIFNTKRHDQINLKYCNQSADIKNFIYMHYITDKTNTKFWSDFSNINAKPSGYEKLISDLKNGTRVFGDQDIIHTHAYYELGYSTGVLTKDDFMLLYKNNNLDKYKYTLMQNITLKKEFIKNLLDHKDFLDIVRGSK